MFMPILHDIYMIILFCFTATIRLACYSKNFVRQIITIHCVSTSMIIHKNIRLYAGWHTNFVKIMRPFLEEKNSDNKKQVKPQHVVVRHNSLHSYGFCHLLFLTNAHNPSLCLNVCMCVIVRVSSSNLRSLLLLC